MKPHMSIAELAAFKKHISNINTYFEFGIGGSTVFVHENTNAQIVGVDSCQEWIERVNEHVDDRVELKFVDIGPIRDWGVPKNEQNKGDWPMYSASINTIEIKPEVILVDGRFRVACLVQIVLFSVKNNIDPTILLHDCNRDHYNPGKKLLKCINQVETLAAYKLNGKYHLEDLELLYNDFKYDLQ